MHLALAPYFDFGTPLKSQSGLSCSFGIFEEYFLLYFWKPNIFGTNSLRAFLEYLGVNVLSNYNKEPCPLQILVARPWLLRFW